MGLLACLNDLQLLNHHEHISMPVTLSPSHDLLTSFDLIILNTELAGMSQTLEKNITMAINWWDHYPIWYAVGLSRPVADTHESPQKKLRPPTTIATCEIM